MPSHDSAASLNLIWSHFKVPHVVLVVDFLIMLRHGVAFIPTIKKYTKYLKTPRSSFDVFFKDTLDRYLG